MVTKFRDNFVSRIALLKCAPEFHETIEYATLRDFLANPSKDVRQIRLRRERTSTLTLPQLSPLRRLSSKRSTSKSVPESPTRGRNETNDSVNRQPSFDKRQPSNDWQEAFEKRLLHEASKIGKNIDKVQKRVEESRSFVQALTDKACTGSAFSAKDMQQLLKVQKETDQLAIELNEYQSLNCRAFFKLLNAYRDVADIPISDDFMPKVLQELGLRNSKVAPPEETISHRMEEFFNALLEDLGAEEREFVAESRAMIANQCHELKDKPPAEPKKVTAEIDSEPDKGQSSFPVTCLKTTLPIATVLMTDYSRNHFAKDFLAAVIISVAGIPKAMSYAALADLPVSSGLATMYVPSIIYALFGSSRQVAISPQSVTCLLLGQMAADTLKGTEFEGDAAHQLNLVLMFTIYAGIAIALFGILNLGFLLNFISKSVLSGFISASAIIATVSAFKSLLGLSVKKSPIVYIMIERVASELPNIHWPTAVIGILGVVYLVVMAPVQKRAAAKLQSMELRLARAGYLLMKVPPVLYFMGIGMFAGMCLCNFQPFVEWAADFKVIGQGATAPALYYGYASAHFDCTYRDRRVASEYTATSSGDGLRAITGTSTSSAGFLHFAASDVNISESKSSTTLLTFPVLSTFVCAVVHIPFLENSNQISLVLDPSTVAAVFAGEILTWSDQRIKVQNPNLPWETIDQDQAITTVVRKGESGTTLAFASGLVSCSGCNSSFWKPNLSMTFGAPKQEAADGNADVIKFVASTPWSIGYASYADVEAAAEPTARCLAWRMDEQKIVTPARAWQSPHGFSWPLPLTSYVLVPDFAKWSCEHRLWVARYLEGLYEHSDAASQLNFKLLARPDVLDSIPCATDQGARPLNRRQLAPSKNANLGTDPLSFKCEEFKPKCSDIKVVGYIDPGVPMPGMPEIAIEIDIAKKITFGLMLAAVALLEHVANVKLYADRGGYSISLRMDLIAVGACNIGGAMFGSFVVAGGFSRSALNEGAVSQVSLLLSVLISFLIVYAIAPILSTLPDAVLNVILFCAVAPLVDFKTVVGLVRLGRHGRTDLFALTIAFLATGFLGVVTGMMLAIAFSMAVFVWNSVFPQISEMRRSPGSLHYVPYTHETQDQKSFLERVQRKSGMSKVFPQTNEELEKAEHSYTVDCVQILRFEAPLWFANSTHLSDRIYSEFKRVALQGIVFDMSTVPWMDNTAANVMRTILEAADERRILIVFANCSSDVRTLLQKICLVKEEQLVPSLYAAEMVARVGFPTPASTVEPIKVSVEGRKSDQVPVVSVKRWSCDTVVVTDL